MDRVSRYKDGGLEKALYDAEGRGRHSEITDSDKAWIISEACKRPKDIGYAAEAWTYAKLTEHINRSAMAAGHEMLETVSKATVWKILEEAEIKPFRMRYYCEKRDSDFDEKMHNVLVVYKQLSFNFDGNGELIVKDEEAPKYIQSRMTKNPAYRPSQRLPPTCHRRREKVSYKGTANTSGSGQCPSLQG